MAISSQSSSYLRPHLRRRPNPITDPVLPNELEREILSWLPVKSLMRFKSVCRIWRSIILDPDFARVHQRRRGAFKGLLISDSSGRRRSPTTNFYYMTPEAPTNQILYHATVTSDGAGIGVTMGSTNQVNGFVCFYYRNRSLLYNVATRESLRLPDSVDEYQTCTYHLGFDPVNKLYKLVKVCPSYDSFDDGDPLADEECKYFLRNSSCEILTFGEGAEDAPLWRNISPPPWEILFQSVCYNGILYWMERVDRHGSRNKHVVAFDLSEERFYLFSPARNYEDYRLARFGPGVCLETQEWLDSYLWLDSQEGLGPEEGPEEGRKLVILCYYHGGGGRELVSTESRSIISIPNLQFMGILPNGKLLLHNTCSYQCFLSEELGYYLYDPSDGAFGNIVLPRVIYPTTTTPSPPWADWNELDISITSYYEENILSPRALISQNPPS